MQFSLHHVAQNKQMVAKWDGFSVLFFKKIHTPSQKTNTKQKHPTKKPNQNQKKSTQSTFSDHCNRMDAGKEGDGADSVVAGKTKSAAAFNLHDLHATIISVWAEISIVP